MIRFLDVFFSIIVFILLLPVFVIIVFLITTESKGGVFYVQKRIGKNFKPFNLLKFRTMNVFSDRESLLTIGEKDSRITKTGYYLRKFKIDELPQLINVIIGNMSLVGPRPEVNKFVQLYNDEQKKILKIKPGITDMASIKFSNENKILAKTKNPEATYINEIMPEKIRLNKYYLNNYNLKTYFKIIFQTIRKLFCLLITK